LGTRCREQTDCRDSPCDPGPKQANFCRGRSSPRDTAQEQPFDVLIHYRHHPCAEQPVGVVRRPQFGGRTHFVIKYADGTRWLLPAWMAEVWAAQIATVCMPRLALAALRTLCGLINSTEMTRTAARVHKCRKGVRNPLTSLITLTGREFGQQTIWKEIRGSRSK
jgi:hypothetical protein